MPAHQQAATLLCQINVSQLQYQLQCTYWHRRHGKRRRSASFHHNLLSTGTQLTMAAVERVEYMDNHKTAVLEETYKREKK